MSERNAQTPSLSNYPTRVLLLRGASRRDAGRALGALGWGIHDVETDAEACRRAFFSQAALAFIPADERCLGVIQRCRGWGAERWTCRPGTGLLAGQVVLERAWLHEDTITAATWAEVVQVVLRGRK